MLFSLFLWLVHLTQIWMFTVALSVRMPFMVCASLSAVALMAGQLPFTFAGLGARDVALVVLLAALYDARVGGGDGDPDLHAQPPAASGRLADHAAVSRGPRPGSARVANGHEAGRMTRPRSA